MPSPDRAILEALAKCAQDAGTAPDLWKLLDDESPMGFTLLSALACHNFPALGLHNLIEWLVKGGQADEAAHLMATLANGFISEASFARGSLAPPAETGNNPAFANMIVEPRDLTTMLLNIVKAKAAADVLSEGPMFIPDLKHDKGSTFASTTVLGAYLMSRNPFGNSATNMQALMMQLMQLFPSSGTPGPFLPEHMAKHAESEAQMHHAISAAVHDFKAVIEAFLRAGPTSRTNTLRFLSNALHLAAPHRKVMQEKGTEMPFTMVAILCHTCVRLAIPVFGSRGAASAASAWFPRQFPTEYFMQHENPATFCAFDVEEEQVITGDRAVPVPERPKPAEYVAKVHLFALGVRAVSIFVPPCYRQWRDMAQRLRYAGVKGRERQAVTGLYGLYVSLITDNDTLKDYVMIADATAEWLATVLAVKHDGSFPRPIENDSDDDGAAAAESSKNVPQSFALWANLPLTILDDIFAVARLFNGMDNKHQPLQVTFFEIRHIASLMLVVMGDAQAFPKPHTHAMFPQFLELLTHKRLPYRHDFMNHEWFAAHVMRACVEGYTIVQPCDHDRSEARYHLANALKDLLEDASLAESVKPKYNDDKDETLEKLSSMVTAEATEGLEHVFESLTKMREIEIANGRQPPVEGHEKFDEYQQSGAMLRSEVLRSMAAIEVFDGLTQHFSRGMARRLVVQQISGALMAFLIKLAGPSAFELKITDPAKYGFKPREMLESIVHNFVKFAGSENFRRYCVQSQTSLDNFNAAVKFILDRRLVPSDDAEALDKMSRLLKQTAEDIEREDEIFEDAPEWARCALMLSPLQDPIALPTAGDDMVFVERETIRHQLLSQPIHPYTREPMTMDDVLAFNGKPDVKAKLVKLRADIAAWVEEAMRNINAKD